MTTTTIMKAEEVEEVEEEEKLLDLDSLLASHHHHGYSSSDTDSDGASNHPSIPHRRTVDEILHDDDDNDRPSTTSTNTESPIDHTLEMKNSSHPRSRFRYHTSPALPKLVLGGGGGGSRRTSDQWLFGGGGVGLSTAKPGAALAAAAAASRPILTPHAAALIQSRTRRPPPTSLTTTTTTTSSSGSHVLLGERGSQQELQLGDLEIVSKLDDDTASWFDRSNNAVASEFIQTSDGKLVNEHDDYNDDDDDVQWDSYQSAVQQQQTVTETLESAETSFNNDPCANLGGVFSSPAAEEAAVQLEPEEVSLLHTFSSDANSHESPRNPDGHQPNILVSDELHSTRAKSSSREEDDALVSEYVDAADDQGIGPCSDVADKGINARDVLTVTNSEISELDDKSDPSSTTTDVESAAKNDLLDLAENIISQLEHKTVAKRADKKAARPLRKPLELAEELEKKHAFSGLDWENDIASQPMKLEGVRRGSIALGYFDVSASNTITRTVSSQLFRRDQGSPQSVAVHFNFVAVGLFKGLVLVVPSKYSPHSADSMDAKMLMLGLQGDNSHPAVTSMCFNQPGDLLFAGYSDGRIVVWDLQKGAAVKVVTGIHDGPVVHLLYLGQDSQVTRLYRVVSGDSKGLVWLITFSVVPWVNRFSFSTTCLLDGQTTGKALCASPLLPDEFCGGSLMSSQPSASGSLSSNSIGSMVGGVLGGDAGRKLSNEKSSAVEEGVVIFATYQSALVARVSPTVVVYAQLSRPDGVREGSMPYTAWKSMGKRNGSSIDVSAEVSEKVSLLAIAWDRKVQVAKLVKSELKVYAKWNLESSAIGVAWLDDEMLVILTANGQLCLFAKDGTMIHQTSFMIDGSGGDDLLVYHMHFINIFGNPEKAFHNSIAVRGATIYVLGPSHLIVCRLLPWKERIQVLKKAGDWMGALNMAMSLFDGQAHGVIDLPRTVNAVQEAITPYLVELLLSYVDEVFSHISVAFCNQIGKLEQLTNSESEANTVISEIKEQFSRVGGVAVEFCVHIRRIDVLFDEILSKFLTVQHKDIFLELLEPYILKDMLGSLPPEVMQALVEHYSKKGWLQRVEQCVLHMDISSLDFNQVVRLCREHRLYGALVYLFNRGLDDFKAPLEELLIVLKSGERETAAALGYQMLVYLKYCFTGLAFPPGMLSTDHN